MIRSTRPISERSMLIDATGVFERRRSAVRDHRKRHAVGGQAAAMAAFKKSHRGINRDFWPEYWRCYYTIQDWSKRPSYSIDCWAERILRRAAEYFKRTEEGGIEMDIAMVPVRFRDDGPMVEARVLREWAEPFMGDQNAEHQ